jgi:hypothetical protein
MSREREGYFSQDEQSNIKLFQYSGTVKQNFLLRCRVAYEKNAQKLVVEDAIIIAYKLPNSMSNKSAATIRIFAIEAVMQTVRGAEWSPSRSGELLSRSASGGYFPSPRSILRNCGLES